MRKLCDSAPPVGNFEYYILLKNYIWAFMIILSQICLNTVLKNFFIVILLFFKVKLWIFLLK